MKDRVGRAAVPSELDLLDRPGAVAEWREFDGQDRQGTVRVSVLDPIDVGHPEQDLPDFRGDAVVHLGAEGDEGRRTREGPHILSRPQRGRGEAICLLDRLAGEMLKRRPAGERGLQRSGEVFISRGRNGCAQKVQKRVGPSYALWSGYVPEDLRTHEHRIEEIHGPDERRREVAAVAQRFGLRAMRLGGEDLPKLPVATRLREGIDARRRRISLTDAQDCSEEAARNISACHPEGRGNEIACRAGAERLTDAGVMDSKVEPSKKARGIIEIDIRAQP
ncbi:hypothetical protein [Methylobacterium nigriterrae]|uniref:hypothetical protein n=1 Tax=Methylobacterium nigriterrae TaxID=3127512 RepID=UPI0030138D2B